MTAATDRPASVEGHQDPGYWEAHLSFEPARVGVWREVTRVIERDIPRGSRVLDMGAGYCYFINSVSVAAERHALDLNPRIRDYVAPGVKAHVGVSTDLSMFGDETLDVVFASNLFEHLSREDFEATLVEVRRVLRTGGRLIALQPNYTHCVREYFDDYTHLTVFSDWSLRHWLEARQFRVVTMRPRFIPGDFRSSKPKWPWMVRLYLNLPHWFRPLAQQMYCVAEKR